MVNWYVIVACGRMKVNSDSLEDKEVAHDRYSTSWLENLQGCNEYLW